jgi:hypothetical protein
MNQQPTGLAFEERPPHEVLAAAIKRRCAILFVGAGVSMAVGLPSWQSLIDHLLDDLGLERDVIAGMHGGYQMLAEYYRLKRGGIGPLRSWLDRNWRVDPDRIAASRLHRLIVELDFPTIYTTNYDRNLETAFEVLEKPYAKISNAKDIASARSGVTHIIKFHGDFDDDASLVLTETDFLNRLAFDSHSISGFAPMPWAARCFSSDTACPIPTFGSCCIGFGRVGMSPGTARTDRGPSRSSRSAIRCRKLYWRTGASPP